ncbi:N-acetyltransferase [Siculibacillus lacustris]|uniref:N-acetyltransferase n=1 Tax=Siculibacillus lacustris TaxID=1549641 RepID=A0A4Q9VX04_9HYPH|nr:GNAT family protein [Siculibacillus lacustris]TBW40773.1 N-acetyltransferase [Siculibacillus lacustris]
MPGHNDERPVGPLVEGWSERARPVRGTIAGNWGRLEPLDAARHGHDLFTAVDGHDSVWTYLGYGPFENESAFLSWLTGREALTDPLYYSVIDTASGRAVGVLTLMETRPAFGVVEIGHIFFAPVLQRTRAATEAIFLAMRHVFDDLGYRRFEWKCDALNAPSRAAAIRFGFTFEGIFRQHVVVKGRNRDTAWYAITDKDWPAVRAGFQAWLRPENFDAVGHQKAALGDLRPKSKTKLGAH